ncbi:MAG TPA: MFS transporter, partial [Roseiflexaceae bacterium]|nr:MFS transporter [Roseiflexaceae bacterium]
PTGLALLLGASPFEIGILGALPFLSQICQFVGAYLEERLGKRRSIVLLTSGLSRGAWILVALLPLAAGPGNTRVALFLLLVALSQAFAGIAINAWTSWMTDLVPARQRGRYFGVRNTVASITAVASNWGAGLVLDQFRAAQQEARGYAVVFGAAVACAAAGLVVLWFQPEPPMRRHERMALRALFSMPLQNAQFRSFSLAAAGWAIAIGIAGPFFNAYGIQQLKLSFTMLATLAVISSLVSIASQPLIGRMQDRYSSRSVLIACVIGTVTLPLGWVFASNTNLVPLYLNAIGAGLFWPGITQGFLNLVMERAPAEGRGAFVAFFGAMSGLGTFMSGILGGAIATAIGPAMFTLGPIVFDHYTILFALSSLGRAAMALVFARRL